MKSGYSLFCDFVWGYNLRALRSVVNSYHSFCAVDDVGRAYLRNVTAQRLSLDKPHKGDGDKKQNDERHASSDVLLYGGKRPFIHSWSSFVRA